MRILQDNGDNDKAAPVSGTPINQRCLGLDINKGSNIGNITGGNVEGSTSSAKDYGKAVNPLL